MYFDKEKFYEELLAFRSLLSCCDLSAGALISDKLGVQVINMIDRTLTNQNFRNYPIDTKEDMRLFALQKCMLAIHKYDLSYGDSNLFSYFSRTIYLGFLTVIAKYYKEKNGKWKYLYQKLLAYGMPHSKIISLIGEDQSRGNGTLKNNIFNNANKSLSMKEKNK